MFWIWSENDGICSKFAMDERIPVLDLQNQQLKKQIADLESELVGARLDAKYLDKELAGRIQQIQILLASNASQEHKQQVWAQVITLMEFSVKWLSLIWEAKQKQITLVPPKYIPIVWLHFYQTLFHILPDIHLDPKPTTTPLKTWTWTRLNKNH